MDGMGRTLAVKDMAGAARLYPERRLAADEKQRPGLSVRRNRRERRVGGVLFARGILY